MLIRGGGIYWRYLLPAPIPLARTTILARQQNGSRQSIAVSVPRPDIDERRFQGRLAALSAVGATGNGGVDRQALTDADIRSHALVLSWFADDRYCVDADAVGNIFVTRAGRCRDAAPTMIGSHLDSQPRGGCYDGALGVLAAAEVLASLDDEGIETERPVTLVMWMNEEGCRFPPVTMGSSVYCGRLPLQAALGSVDAEGLRFGDRLPAFLGGLGIDPYPDRLGRPDSYAELHIEQGPLLEAGQLTIGVVTGIQGVQQYRVTVRGQRAHAGTTPSSMRKDAFAAAMRMAAGLERVFDDEEGATRFTIGRFDVAPGAANTVPDLVTFLVDLRHPHGLELARYDRLLHEVCAVAASPCSAAVERLIAVSPVAFAADVRTEIERSARRHGLPLTDILSGATHDAANMAGLCRAGMIFIPCRDGVSHHESEHAELADMLAGTRVLRDVVLSLAR